MSFRVKASHGFLKSIQPAPQKPQRSLDELLHNEESKHNWNYENNQSKKSAVYVPASNAHINQAKGLVIRPNPRAQEDYM